MTADAFAAACADRADERIRGAVGVRHRRHTVQRWVAAAWTPPHNPDAVGRPPRLQLVGMGIWTDQFVAPARPVLLDVDGFTALAADLVRERVVRTPWLLVGGTLCANAELPYVSVLWDARSDDPPTGARLVTEPLPPWAEYDDEDDEPPPWGRGQESATVLAKGDSIDALPAALATAPYGTQDIALLFHGLDFTNRVITKHYRGKDCRILLAVFALAHAQQRPLAANANGYPGGPHHPVRTFVSTGYKHGDDEIPAPLKAVLRRHFGADLISGLTRT